MYAGEVDNNNIKALILEDDSEAKIKEAVSKGAITLDNVRKAVAQHFDPKKYDRLKINALVKNLNAAVEGKQEYYRKGTGRVVHAFAMWAIFGGSKGKTKTEIEANKLLDDLENVRYNTLRKRYLEGIRKPCVFTMYLYEGASPNNRIERPKGVELDDFLHVVRKRAEEKINQGCDKSALITTLNSVVGEYEKQTLLIQEQGEINKLNELIKRHSPDKAEETKSSSSSSNSDSNQTISDAESKDSSGDRKAVPSRKSPSWTTGKFPSTESGRSSLSDRTIWDTEDEDLIQSYDTYLNDCFGDKGADVLRQALIISVKRGGNGRLLLLRPISDNPGKVEIKQLNDDLTVIREAVMKCLVGQKPKEGEASARLTAEEKNNLKGNVDALVADPKIKRLLEGQVDIVAINGKYAIPGRGDKRTDYHRIAEKINLLSDLEIS